MRVYSIILTVLIGVTGCNHSKPNASEPSDLRPLVGQRVQLEGRFGGPGKLADYIVVPGGQIYLMGKIDSFNQKLEYGSTISVEGVLGYRSYPPSTKAENEPTVARPPDHYFIENAKASLVQQPGK